MKDFTMHRRIHQIAFVALAVLIGANAPAEDDFAAFRSSSAWQPKRLADGQPDVRGFWRAEHGGTYSLTNPRAGQDGEPGEDGKVPPKAANGMSVPKTHKPSRIIDPSDGQVPYQPWAREHQAHLAANFENPTKQEYIDPQARCLPGGVLRTQWWHEYEIRQFPGYVVFLFDAASRIVRLDGAPHIPANIKLWMSDSRGRWEGNTLIVDVTNSNAKHRLSNEGDFSSDNVHIQERFTFVDANTYRYEATITDPTVYTRPWTVASKQKRAHADDSTWEAWEYGCIEGEKNSANSLLDGSAFGDLQ
jgi:hypothetical protein